MSQDIMRETAARKCADATLFTRQKDEAVERLKAVCEKIITGGLAVRNGQIGAGLDAEKEAKVNADVKEFQSSGDPVILKNHANDLVRSMTSLVQQREMQIKEEARQTPSEKSVQSHRETQLYIIQTMVQREWKGTQTPPSLDGAPAQQCKQSFPKPLTHQ